MGTDVKLSRTGVGVKEVERHRKLVEFPHDGNNQILNSIQVPLKLLSVENHRVHFL